MNVEILLFVLLWVSSIHSRNDIDNVPIEIIHQSRFDAPVDRHLIGSFVGVQSLMKCGILCHRHSICRTADYDSTGKVCRLFETYFSMGMYQNDPSTSILTLNYCANDTQREPEYICTRSGTFTVQEIFNNLSSATNVILPSSDRGVYADINGIYTSSYSGYISFFTYAGATTILENLSSEVTNIDLVGSSGLVIVQFYQHSAIISNNIGTLSKPNLVPILNISLPAAPYSCLSTSDYFTW